MYFGRAEGLFLWGIWKTHPWFLLCSQKKQRNKQLSQFQKRRVLSFVLLNLRAEMGADQHLIRENGLS